MNWRFLFQVSVPLLPSPPGKGIHFNSWIFMKVNRDVIEQFFTSLPAETQSRVASAQNVIVKAKERGKNVVAAIGSGPNLHEGVTTLIAELMHKGIIDGVTTSSAVISHEMAGTLDRVKGLTQIFLACQKTKTICLGYLKPL